MSDENVQSNKLQIMGKLTASLLHEIRNPLSAIKLGIAHLKMLEEELPEEANETIQASSEALDRIQELVENVLDFSRRGINNIVPCSINRITENSIQIVNGSAIKSKINISKNFDETLPEILVEKNKVLQVFINLLSNAIEAIENEKKGGNIFVSTFMEHETGKVVWSIADDGTGISETDKEKIFNDFFTLKKTGTGLGLSVCKNILNDYKSDLCFESEKGKGTTFYVKFNNNLIKG